MAQELIGNNFGLNSEFDYYEFQFDSKDAKGSLSPPTLDPQVAQYNFVNWPLFTMGRPVDEIAAMKVLEVQIPFSYYIIHSLNNKFILLENGGVPVPLNPVVIPPGNYTPLTLASALEAALQAVSTYTGIGPNPYTVTYNSTTKKFTIEANVVGTPGTFSLVFGEDFNNGFDNPRYILGFHANTNTAATIGPGNYKITGPLVAQITGPNYLFLNSSLMGQQCKLYLPEGSFGQGNIGPQIAKIPVNTNPGGIIFWQNPDPQKWFNLESSNNINNIDFYCTLGNEPTKIDFNGVSFSITLGILFHRKEHTTFLNSLLSEGRVAKRIRG